MNEETSSANLAGLLGEHARDLPAVALLAEAMRDGFAVDVLLAGAATLAHFRARLSTADFPELRP